MHVNRSACIQQGHNVEKFDHIAALVRQSWPNATGDLDRDLSNFVVGRGIPKLPARMLDADMMETLVDGALQASSYKTNPAALSRDQIKHVIRGACQS
jgi:alcohol dehydrogenase class IV